MALNENTFSNILKEKKKRDISAEETIIPEDQA